MSLVEKKRILNRKEAARYLTDHGYKTAPGTLAVKACRGDGPPFVKYGPYPGYDPDDLLEWAQNRLSRKVCSTAELVSFGSSDKCARAGEPV